jgi:peptidoglycan L-alanyl-D-glutamate endopeptidase CwlK
MLTSRKIDDLLTPAKLRALNFVHQCKEAGIDLIVTCTVRDGEAQNLLYAQGRTREQLDAAGLTRIEPRPGRVVTNCIGGFSFHQWRVAMDVVPVIHGKPVWDTAGAGINNDPTDDETNHLEIWQRVGVIGERCDLEWAGRWKHNREFPHFQFTGGLSIEDFRAGKSIPPELTQPRSRVA